MPSSRPWLETERVGLHMQLLIVGDSHSVSSFAGVAEAKIHHVSGVTMHRAARDGIKSIIPENWRPTESDILVFSLGEIDSRAQIPKHARLNGRSTLEETDALCDRFEVALDVFRESCPAKMAICCIAPFNPYMLAHEFYNSSDEATDDARNIRNRMNVRLQNMGVHFLDVRPHFSNPDGTLIPSKSDGNVHLDPRISGPMIKELHSVFGQSFSPTTPPWPIVFKRTETTHEKARRKALKDLQRSIRQVLPLLPGVPVLQGVINKVRGR